MNDSLENLRQSAGKTFLCMEIAAKAAAMERSGRSVVHLEIGEPDFATPQVIVDAAIRALRDGKTKYTCGSGLRELREAIAGNYAAEHNVQVCPERVVVNAGSSPALLCLFLTAVGPGDEVIVSDPGYPGYRQFIDAVGAIAVPVDTSDCKFHFSPDDVARRITPKTKAIIVNSPSNPVGARATKGDLEKFAELGPLVISDEVYHGLTFGDEPEHTMLEFGENVAVVNSFSKRFAMTGWRLGYVIPPRVLVPRVRQLQQSLFISPNSFVQWAGIAALTSPLPELNEMRAKLVKRRDYLVNELGRLGLTVPHVPDGAFYILADIRRFTGDSLAFTSALLDEAAVAVDAGIDFGAAGEGFVRFSFTTSMEQLREGICRLERFLHGHFC